MSDYTKRFLIGWVFFFLSATSVSWSIAVSSIYAPKRTPLERCAETIDAHQTDFCLLLARQK